MLAKLFVHNYALIKGLDIELDNGLTIITGETGAGKSILLGALSLILGARADTSVLLDKNEKCVVEGIFHIGNYNLKDFFDSYELDYEPVTILRREINPAGKSRAFINDTPVNVNVLKALGDKLIDIHSQHQSLMLNDNAFQLSVIDSFADISTQKAEYRNMFLNYRNHLREYNELKEKSDKNRSDLDYFQFQLRQLEEAGLKAGEQEELEREQELLTHSEEIKLALDKSVQIFSAEGNSVLPMLKEIIAVMGRIKSFLPDAEAIINRTDTAYIELSDLASDIERLSSRIDSDPDRLEKVNARLDLLYSLMLKHRVKNVDELLEKKREIETAIKSINTNDDRIKELETIIDKEKASLKHLAEIISAKRKTVIPEIERKVTTMLQQLGMPNAKFKITLSFLSEFTSSGVDFADFLFSANKQISPENLTKIASGGELSRVMLSLKALIVKNANLPAVIFDEIDAGVSGEIADKVGQILSEMGRYMQVINITHLPQVASRGTRHFHVYKDESGDTTITRIRLLNDEERVYEIARLLSGSEITETAVLNARELITAGITGK